MFPETFSNSTSLSEEVSAGSSHGNNTTTTRLQDLSPILFSSSSTDHHHHEQQQQQQSAEETTTKTRKKRNLPGNPDPNAEVVSLSPTTLMATNRFVCEVCNKGFQRDQNLQLHRRGHNLPWKLKQRSNTDVVRRKVYVCPEVSCIHHHPSRALGDLTGIKKHFSRKHGERKWKCEKCSKKYAVQSDWKAHSKNCGTKEYRCDCGTLFARKDSFITHRAFCDALAEESARLVSSSASNLNNSSTSTPLLHHYNNEPLSLQTHSSLDFQHQQSNNTPSSLSYYQFTAQHHQNFPNPTPISIITSSSSWTDHPSPTSDPVKLENQHNNQILIPTPISSFYQESPPLPSPNTAAAAAISDQQKSLFTPNFLRHFSNSMVSNSNTSTSYRSNTSTHMSATALLQKAANFGAGPIGGPTMQTQSVGHMSGSSMSQMNIMSQMGKTCLSSPSEEFLGFASSNSANQSTWQKKDFRLTRDFLGLAPADHNSVTNVLDVNERNQMNGKVNVRKSDLLSYTGGVDFGAYERGFAAGAWRNC